MRYKTIELWDLNTAHCSVATENLIIDVFPFFLFEIHFALQKNKNTHLQAITLIHSVLNIKPYLK